MMEFRRQLGRWEFLRVIFAAVLREGGKVVEATNGNMHKKLTLCSLFDGSGGFCLGAELAGVKPVESSEIEPFPILVTQKRLPQVKHYGDVSQLRGGDLEAVDIITFGSP